MEGEKGKLLIGILKAAFSLLTSLKFPTAIFSDVAEFSITR